ncbi:MAG: HAD-IA family hydrolase [Kiloniellaceae bacterium]|nr:HAD-IA family hydrolase [Kiloniellaceae bacterium]
MRAASIELVIFDCDGVLVDSEPLAMRVLLQMLSRAGAELAPERAYEAFLGRSLASVCDILRRDYDVDLGDDALERMRRDLNAVIRSDLQPIPGVAATLESLRRPFCVASSSQPERIRLSLEVTGLAGYFGDDVFSATMVTHGKPAPDLFLHAAERMQVAPGRCMVVEDSPAGVSAALRAGMRVVGFTGGSHARLASHRRRLAALKPHGMLDDMLGLPGLLRGLEKGRKVS